MRDKLLIKFFISLFIITLLINLFQAQSVIDPNAYNLTALCAQSISSAADDKSLNNCIPIKSLELSLPLLFDKSSNNPTGKLNVLSQLVKDTCALKPCSNDIILQLLQTLKSQCSQDLESKNLIITTFFELFNYYDLVRDIICLRDSAKKYNSFCVLETLVNIGNALNSTSSAHNNVNRRSPNNIVSKRCIQKTNIDNTNIEDLGGSTVITTRIFFSKVSNIPTSTASEIFGNSKTTSISASTTLTTTINAISSSTLIPIPQSTFNAPQSISNDTCPPDMSLMPVMKPLLSLSSQVICTDCNKAIFTKILLYTKKAPMAFNCTPFAPIVSMAPAFLSQKCDPQFLDQNIPSSISSATSILKHVSFHGLLGIGCLSIGF
ncbi:7194_t:CDS:2, partial [Cetraspora pellucida]